MLAPRASADEAEYLQDARSENIAAPANALLDAGYWICRFVASGNNPNQATPQIERSNLGLTHHESVWLVVLALNNLCPQNWPH